MFVPQRLHLSLYDISAARQGQRLAAAPNDANNDINMHMQNHTRTQVYLLGIHIKCTCAEYRVVYFRLVVFPCFFSSLSLSLALTLLVHEKFPWKLGHITGVTRSACANKRLQTYTHTPEHRKNIYIYCMHLAMGRDGWMERDKRSPLAIKITPHRANVNAISCRFIATLSRQLHFITKIGANEIRRTWHIGKSEGLTINFFWQNTNLFICIVSFKGDTKSC